MDSRSIRNSQVDWFFLHLIRTHNRTGYAVSAEFQSGDNSYEWLVNYLVRIFPTAVASLLHLPQMTEQVWQTPRNIYVKSKNSQRKWKLPTDTENRQVDYVPDFGAVQFFCWRGYWLDVSRLQEGFRYEPYMGDFEQALPIGPPSGNSIALKLVNFRLKISELLTL